MIVDYSTLRPPTDLLTAFSVTAVGRYIGWDDQPGYKSIGKNITKDEAAQLDDAGIAVFLAFEYAADAAAQGAAQGAKDGDLATKQLAALGAPPDMGVYFALDFDIPDYAPRLPNTPANARAKLGPAAYYFEAIHAGKPAYQVGAYGGYWAVKRLFDAGLITLGWQTIAWSGGQREVRAQLYQTGSITLAGGADVDVHESTAADFGQWPRPVPPPPGWAYGPPRDLRVRPGRHNFHADWAAPAGAPEKPAAYMLWVYQGAVCDQDTLVDTYPRGERGTETLPDPGGLDPGTDYTLHVAAMGLSGAHMQPGVYAAAQFTTAPQPVLPSQRGSFRQAPKRGRVRFTAGRGPSSLPLPPASAARRVPAAGSARPNRRTFGTGCTRPPPTTCPGHGAPGTPGTGRTASTASGSGTRRRQRRR